MMNEALLFELLHEYRRKCVIALQGLKDNSSRFNNYSQSQNRFGVFKLENGNVEFSFHGVGCWFKFDNGEFVDIDFGSGRIDQINIYFLTRFLESKKEPGNVVQVDEIIETLNKLVAQGHVLKIERYYYLSNDPFQKQFRLY